MWAAVWEEGGEEGSSANLQMQMGSVYRPVEEAKHRLFSLSLLAQLLPFEIFLNSIPVKFLQSRVHLPVRRVC